MTRHLASLVGSMLSIAVAAACSGGGEGSPSDVEFGDFGRDEIEVQGEITRPSVDDLVFVRQAEEEMTRTCMEEAGFEYVPQAVNGSDVSLELDMGMLPPGYLRSFGYGTTLTPSTRLGVDPNATNVTMPPTANDEIVAALPPDEAAAWHEALSGPDDGPTVSMVLPDGSTSTTSTGGCRTRSGIELYGSVEAFVNFRSTYLVASDAGRLLGEEPEYVAAVTEWYGCMNAAGYDPGGAPDGGRLAWEAYRDLPVDQARQAEMTIAAVDADCQEQVGLPEVESRLGDAALREAAADHGFDLVGRQEAIQHAVARARAVIVDGD